MAREATGLPSLPQRDELTDALVQCVRRNNKLVSRYTTGVTRGGGELGS